jgi:hypothetical protein
MAGYDLKKIADDSKPGNIEDTEFCKIWYIKVVFIYNRLGFIEFD